ncbi:hypothetical protein REC12_19985 [Desulfosporosinus sp. PR]|uniref:hypothetical protein n=1 Tax=Candidatus Desulfosporosinus nitrosoreducens TaxID=3401928 RepID=UPI0027F515D1|nr:hypothetical protein [Desulfosporosinus sp. PR]MDQ7095878.1 hypothetical protein [Desulfosporosinus sp. PR]
MKKKSVSLVNLITGILGILLAGYFWLSAPQDTQAACGASTSSCKTCHEVQGADPVSKKGDWHSQHSFGDFCQACHLGVATETDKTKAHAGLVANPLSQPDQSCVSCHPADTAARVAKYGGTATASGSTGSASTVPGSSGVGTDAAAGAGGGTVAPSPAASQIPPSANPNFDLIDFNSRDQLSWLAWVLILADILALLALGVLLWKWKKGLWPWAFLKGKQKNVPFNTLPPEVQDVFRQLLKGDMHTVLTLKTILASEHGPQLLQVLTQLPEEVVLLLPTMNEEELKSLVLPARKKGKGED